MGLLLLFSLILSCQRKSISIIISEFSTNIKCWFKPGTERFWDFGCVRVCVCGEGQQREAPTEIWDRLNPTVDQSSITCVPLAMCGMVWSGPRFFVSPLLSCALCKDCSSVVIHLPATSCANRPFLPSYVANWFPNCNIKGFRGVQKLCMSSHIFSRNCQQNSNRKVLTRVQGSKGFKCPVQSWRVMEEMNPNSSHAWRTIW